MTGRGRHFIKWRVEGAILYLFNTVYAVGVPEHVWHFSVSLLLLIHFTVSAYSAMFLLLTGTKGTVLFVYLFFPWINVSSWSVFFNFCCQVSILWDCSRLHQIASTYAPLPIDFPSVPSTASLLYLPITVSWCSWPHRSHSLCSVLSAPWSCTIVHPGNLLDKNYLRV